MTITRLHPPDVTGSARPTASDTDPVVCKFGGTSVADAGQIERVRAIVADDPRRRLVVVSAPGRRHPDEEKVTDHLINFATDGAHLGDRRDPIPPATSREAVIERFRAIIDDLGIGGAGILEDLRTDLDRDHIGDRRIAYLASRGEHYCARVVAAYFGSTGLRARVRFPEDFGLRVEGDRLAARMTDAAQERLSCLDDEESVTVVPGFYGVTDDGGVAVFSRGGSDLTGGELAAAVDAHAYENWTDVSGVLEADPGVIPEARVVPRLTFKELRLLASKGFNVFHLDAVLNCRRRGVPIHIRNTNRPQDPGTRILNERVPEERVVGIARLDDVAYIYLEKDDLSEEIGFTADLLRIFQEFGINTYHYPTDKDDIAVLVRQDDLKGSINDLRRAIEARLEPDVMDVVYNLSILTAVGLGLRHDSTPLVAAISALGEHNVPIEMFHQSPSQLCFHVGVGQSVADQASRILYDALVRGTGTTTTPSRSA
jgi:aspartate kinase